MAGLPKQRRTVLAIDPAAEREQSDTGWALGTFSEDEPLEIIDSGVVHGGFDGFVSQLGQTQDEMTTLQIKIMHAKIIICEKFVVWEPRADSTPRLIEGIVRYLRPDTVLQPASGKNTLVPDLFLKKQGHWGTQSSGAGHHRDRVEAIRHIYVYLAKNYHIPTLKLLNPNFPKQ